MNKVITGYSTQSDVNAAVREIKEQFGSFEPTLVLFFASSRYAPDSLAAEMQSGFSKAQTMGCTTAGEIVTGKMLQNSITAMGFSKAIIPQVCVTAVENMDKDGAATHALQTFERIFGETMQEMSFEKYVGFILTDGLSLSEEKIMDQLGDATNITFIGGSAGDDLKFEKTFVFVNGKSYAHAAALALMKPAVGFEIIKTQSFAIKDARLVATKVNEATREVVEFNGRPAVDAYAEAVGERPENLSDRFMRNPLGLVSDGDPFVRSPQQLKDKSVIFYCQVLEGMELSVLEATDLIEDTRKAVEAKLAEMGGACCLINFHCILRTLELRQKGLEPAYGALFTETPTIGFSTYGEQYIGHINQTSTILAFKNN